MCDHRRRRMRTLSYPQARAVYEDRAVGVLTEHGEPAR
jgi:hypothetical protein